MNMYYKNITVPEDVRAIMCNYFPLRTHYRICDKRCMTHYKLLFQENSTYSRLKSPSTVSLDNYPNSNRLV